LQEDSPAPERIRRGIQSINVGTAILKGLTRAPGPLYLRELAQAVGMPASKIYRYLVSFAGDGLVVQDKATGRYDLGPFAIELGLAALGRMDEIGIIGEELDRLIQAARCDGNISVWGASGATVIRWRQGPTDAAIRVREGTILQLLTSATGRVWGCYLDPAVTKPLIEAEASGIAAKSGEAKKAILSEYNAKLLMIKKHGLSRSEEERRPGVDALAGPVFDRSGKMVFALTIVAWISPTPVPRRPSFARPSRKSRAGLEPPLKHLNTPSEHRLKQS
jgi:DNA-binding IclR family transcriptional regulator